jgi:hypothetical protein
MPNPEGLETSEYVQLIEARIKNQEGVVEQTRQQLNEENDRTQQIILKNRLNLEQADLEGIKDELEMMTVKS